MDNHVGSFKGVSGWIPPEFREHLYEEISIPEAEAIQGLIGTVDLNGVMTPFTVSEIQTSVRRAAGVRDIRTGEVHPR